MFFCACATLSRAQNLMMCTKVLMSTHKRKQSSREERRSNGENGGKKALLEWVYVENMWCF